MSLASPLCIAEEVNNLKAFVEIGCECGDNDVAAHGASDGGCP